MTTTQQNLLRSPPLVVPNQALFLDFDGTLVELAEHPDAVNLSAGLQGWLLQLQTQLDGAVGLVTGRRLSSVDGFLDPVRLAGTGAHGAEARWSGYTDIAAAVPALEADWVQQLRDAIESLSGVWLENKLYGVALHWRQNPAAAADCERLLRTAVAGTELVVVPGHCVVEARRQGLGKDISVQRLMALPGFAGRVPVFVGDDHADEEAFAAVQALGGYGVKVGLGDTVAHYQLASVSETHRWLRESLMSLRSTT